MDEGRGRGSPLGERPPPKRTYGSQQGSRRLVGSNYPLEGEKSPLLLSAASSPTEHKGTATALLRPALENGFLRAGEACGSGGLVLRQSTVRFSGTVGGSVRSAESMLQLVRAAGRGGEDGRLSAIALAQSCKSRESREAMRANATDILSELTSTMLVSLRVGSGDGQQDEATVHGLAVAMFILSKDPALVKAFSASAVSTLALLIEGGRGKEGPLGACTATAGGASSVAATAGGRRQKSASLVRKMGTSSGKHNMSKRGDDEGSCPFDMSDEDEDEEEPLGRVSGGILSASKTSSIARPVKTDKRSLHANDGAYSCIAANRNSAPHTRNCEHGSANAMARARMLLDIADIVPWGMANRHLVSAADLGLATLLNVAAQACPESGEKRVSGATGTCGVSVDEDFSTQGSMGSQSEPGATVGASVNGQADGSNASSTSNNAGVMPELSRLAPTGFLLPVVIGGASSLTNLSASSLRSVHQLVLALRLLDLATLESSSESEGATARSSEGAKATRQWPSPHYAELIGALLIVVAECHTLCDHGTPAAAACERQGEARVDGFGERRNQQTTRSSQPVVGDDVAARVHECLLAALRVLINITHHDAGACAEVASRGGLETLMSCLVRSCSIGQGSDSNRSNGGPLGVHLRSDLELLGDLVNGGVEDLSETGVEGDNDGRVGTGAGDFDAQVLAMSALINCVELKESADNCAAMASLRVHPPAFWAAGERTIAEDSSKHDQALPGVGGLRSSKCLAPEFLANLLIRCTRNFAHQLEADRLGGIDDDSPAPPPPSKTQQRVGRVIACGAPTTKAAAAPATSLMPSAGAATPQNEDGGDQLMSHAEGTDLVLGGHCALLLGLLIREQESNRRLVLPMLPDGDPSLVVRVLEAFMALQFQAGVLTEEVVLAVQGLVEELERLDALPVEKWNPFEVADAGDDASDVVSKPAAAAAADTTATASQQRDRKRPRKTPVTSGSGHLALVQGAFATPPPGQWVVEAGRGNGSADDFSLSAERPLTVAQAEEASPLRMTQSPSEVASPTSKLRKRSASSSPASAKAASEERPATATPSQRSSSSGSDETPPPRSQNRGSRTKTSQPWPVGSASSSARIGIGLCGRNAAGRRSWLGTSPQLQSYRNRSTYGSETWRKPSFRTLARPEPSFSYGRGGEEAAEERGLAVGQGGKATSSVFEISSEEDSGGDLQDTSSAGGASSSVGGFGEGLKSGRSGMVALTATGPSFDVNDWSDLSNDGPAHRNSRQKASTKGAPIATCQLQSLGNSRRSGGGCGAGGSGGGSGAVAAHSKSDKRRRRSPSPSPLPTAVPPEGRNYSFQGGGPRSIWSVGRQGSTKVAAAPTSAISVAKANGAESSRHATCKSSNSNDWGVGARPQLSRQDGRSAGAGVLRIGSAVRHAVGGRESARGLARDFKEHATRGVLGTDRLRGQGTGASEKPASRNVFEMDDEDESD